MLGGLIAASVVVMLPALFVYLAPCWALYGAIFCFRRLWSEAVTTACWAAAATLALVGMVSLNYLTTGLPDVTPWNVCCGYWNQDLFSNWSSVYLFLWLKEGSGSSIVPIVKENDLLLPHVFAACMHVKAVEPIFLGIGSLGILVAVAVAAILGWGRTRGQRRRGEFGRCWEFAWGPCLLMGLLVWVSMAASGQQTSAYRVTRGFIIFFTVLAAIAFWRWIVNWVSPDIRNLAVSPVLVWIAVAPIWTYLAGPHAGIRIRSAFMLGRMDLWKAYAAEGILVEPFLSIRQRIGVERKIVFFNNESKFTPLFLVGRGLSSPMDHGYGPKWHLMAFENAERAKAALREEGYDFFLIDISQTPFDMIAHGELFSPDTLRTRFKVIDVEFPYYFLTWREPSPNEHAMVLMSQFAIESWQQAVTLDSAGKRLFERLRYLYRLNDGRTKGVVRPPDLPPVQGWQ